MYINPEYNQLAKSVKELQQHVCLTIIYLFHVAASASD
jgi:hypothetical protein